jgi:hypothetical protein
MEVTMRDRKGGIVERNTALLLTLGAVVLIGIVTWRVVEWLQIASALGVKDRIQIEADVLKTTAQILGGGALLAGLYFTWKNVQMLQEGQITERFTRSIEHLGSDKLEVRLGGIYALGRLARDCKKDQQSISDVLCAYVRDRARWEENGAPKCSSIDIQAVLTLLGSQTWARDPVRPWLDLSGTDLRGADLCWAHLETANLTGSHLEGARLVEAHLEEAYFVNAHVEGADFTGALLDRADLDGAIGLTEEQIRAARTTTATRLPKRLPVPRGGE